MRPLARTPVAPSSAFPSALRSGLLAAIGTWSVVVLPALVGWVAAPESTLGWFSAVSVGSAIWFLGHGQSVGTAGGVAVSLTPVLLLAVFVYIAFRFARRLAATERLRVGAESWSQVAAWGVVPGFLTGYGAGAAVFALFTLGGPATPGAAAVLGSLLVPLGALGFALVRPEDDLAPGFVKAWFRRGPTWLPAVWGIGWRGAGMLLGAGGVLVVLRLLVSWREVVEIQGQYGVDVAAGVVVAIAQVALLGNAATWALGFLSGAGFQVALGSTISPALAQPGLLPLVPVLGALPDAAAYPRTMYAVVAVPVLIGGYLARRVDRELEFFGNLLSRVAATLTAAVLPVLVVVGVTALANGAVGVDRLSGLGVPLLPFAEALSVEVVAGALLYLALLLAREHWGSHDDAAGAEAPVGAATGAGKR